MKSLVKALSIGASRYAQEGDVSWRSGAGEPSKTGLRNWLMDGTGYTNVSRNSVGQIFVECVGDSWAISNGSDLIANREAARESLFPRSHSNYSNRSLAWPIVTTYYSLYFAAQTLLRCLGIGSIYLEEREALSLSNAFKLRGIPSSFVSGNYIFSIDISGPITIVLRKQGAKGGAHKQFWNGFEQSQQAIRAALLTSPALNTLSSGERSVAMGEFNKLMQDSFSDGRDAIPKLNFEWPSIFRNGVNYRFDGRAWLMSWQHSAGLIPHYEGVILRYLGSKRILPNEQRNFSKNHLAFAAARFCQIVDAATHELALP